MSSGWKALGLLAGLAWCLANTPVAEAQFMPPGGGFGPPGGGYGPPPGAFGGGPAMGMPMSGGGMPTAFGGNPNHSGMPADFPNAGIPSKEPVSPFSIKDEGMPNAFTELVDNRLHASPCWVFRQEYLGWWIRRGPVAVPLVSTTNNFAGGEVGAQGEPNSVFLVPASSTTIDYKMLSGVRMALGFAPHWFPPVEVSGFAFNRNYTVFSGGSVDGTGQYLARPIQLTDLGGLNTVEFVNVPGFAAGNIDVLSRLSFWNVETNVFFNCCDNGTVRLDLIFGYRHADLNETLEINTRVTGVNGTGVNFGGNAFPSGFTAITHDSFYARNAFDGGQIGLRNIFCCHNGLKVFTDMKLAMGATNQYLRIEGVSRINNAIPGQAGGELPGGVLALPSNSGYHSQQNFSIIPELSISLSYQCTNCLRIFGGYNLLYWTNVIRPGDHVTNTVDGRQIPTDQNFIPGFQAQQPAYPSFVIRDFVAHGFFAGFELGW